MSVTGDHKLPFGNLPRLILAWVSTEAVRTKSRELVLGKSFSEFMRTLGVYSSDGKAYTRLRNQMGRLFNAHVRLVYKDERVEASVSSSVADRTEFWWNERKPDEPVLFDSKIRLGEDLFNEIIPVPGAARHEHPQGHEALFSGPGLVPVVNLSALLSEAPTTALLAAPVPAVRSGPGQGKRQAHC